MSSEREREGCCTCLFEFIVHGESAILHNKTIDDESGHNAIFGNVPLNWIRARKVPSSCFYYQQFIPAAKNGSVFETWWPMQKWINKPSLLPLTHFENPISRSHPLLLWNTDVMVMYGKIVPIAWTPPMNLIERSNQPLISNLLSHSSAPESKLTSITHRLQNTPLVPHSLKQTRSPLRSQRQICPNHIRPKFHRRNWDHADEYAVKDEEEEAGDLRVEIESRIRTRAAANVESWIHCCCWFWFDLWKFIGPWISWILVWGNGYYLRSSLISLSIL